jgi:hypothetical protein
MNAWSRAPRAGVPVERADVIETIRMRVARTMQLESLEIPQEEIP